MVYGCTLCTPMKMSKNNLIGHVDADCFYVSCERARFSGLEGKAVGVLGNQGACVIAKSYELKHRGVKTGAPIWDAQKLCPEAIYIKRDFHWYEALSRKMLKLIQTISPEVEYYSIDELFFDASYLPYAFKLPMKEACLALQAQMKKEIGIPVSIGVASTKILAKLLSDSSKPYGIGVVQTEVERHELLKKLSVDEISGIAKKSKEKLMSYNIHTCEQFALADRKLIRRILTKKGEDLWWEINGTTVMPMLTQRPYHKNIARGGSLGGATCDEGRLKAWVARNTERLIEALHRNEFYCQRVALFLGFSEGFGTFGRAELLEPSAHYEEIFPIALSLFLAAWKDGQKINYMHVFGEKLQFRSCYQASLFSKKNSGVPDTSAIIRLVNDKVGRFAVRTGTTIPLYDIYSDKAQSYDICDVHGKICF